MTEVSYSGADAEIYGVCEVCFKPRQRFSVLDGSGLTMGLVCSSDLDHGPDRPPARIVVRPTASSGLGSFAQSLVERSLVERSLHEEAQLTEVATMKLLSAIRAIDPSRREDILNEVGRRGAIFRPNAHIAQSRSRAAIESVYQDVIKGWL